MELIALAATRMPQKTVNLGVFALTFTSTLFERNKLMQQEHGHQTEAVCDPFNMGYFLAAVATLLAFPLMHVILGWFVFYL